MKELNNKVPHPGQATWHATMSPYEKEIHFGKVADANRRYHANTSEEVRKKKSKACSDAKKAYYKTYAGYIDKLYRKYLSSNTWFVSSKRKAEIVAARREGMVKTWNSDPKRRAERIAASRKGIEGRIHEVLEFNVPREKDFCGVVRETA
jgi:hypothetical protein